MGCLFAWQRGTRTTRAEGEGKRGRKQIARRSCEGKARRTCIKTVTYFYGHYKLISIFTQCNFFHSSDQYRKYQFAFIKYSMKFLPITMKYIETTEIIFSSTIKLIRIFRKLHKGTDKIRRQSECLNKILLFLYSCAILKRVKTFMLLQRIRIGISYLFFRCKEVLCQQMEIPCRACLRKATRFFETFMGVVL